MDRGQGEWVVTDDAAAMDDASETEDKAEIGSAKTRRFTVWDWFRILGRTWSEASKDNLTLVSAGVAFYAILALFPGIAALVALYGIVSDPVDIQVHLKTMDEVLPDSAYDIIDQQVTKVTGAGRTALGFATIFSLGLALWSSKAGVNAMISGLNIVYNERERRNYFVALFIALALTVLLLLVAMLSVGVVVAAPIVLQFLPLGPIGTWIAAILRWPVIVCAVILTISALYRWGPRRAGARVSWVSYGAAIATAIWLVASLGFSFYVANFGSYNETYGSLGAVIVLLMWFFISAYVVLLGAELNAQIERYGEARTSVPTSPAAADPAAGSGG